MSRFALAFALTLALLSLDGKAGEEPSDDPVAVDPSKGLLIKGLPNRGTAAVPTQYRFELSTTGWTGTRERMVTAYVWHAAFSLNLFGIPLEFGTRWEHLAAIGNQGGRVGTQPIRFTAPAGRDVLIVGSWKDGAPPQPTLAWGQMDKVGGMPSSVSTCGFHDVTQAFDAKGDRVTALVSCLGPQ